MSVDDDMLDEAVEPESKPIRLKADGTPDMRGRSPGSRAGQFAPGDGRKRPGRMKGSRDRKAEVIAVRDMLVTVKRPDGSFKQLTTQQAFAHVLREKGLKGDLKAMAQLERMFERYEDIETQPDLTRPLLEEDLSILAGARERGLIVPLGNPMPLEYHHSLAEETR